MAGKIHRNSLQPGFKLHWYRVEKILGQGGFGITYLAHDFNLDRRVAIKEYLPIELAVRERDSSVHPVTEGHGEQFRWGLDRFLVEARTLARFRHPNIVLVLNVFEANNTAYMVMGYEQGESLQEVLTRRKFMDEAELVNVLIPILGGLQQVQEAGFIHRDIKPANIFLREDGSPVLLDFGSARQALGVATQTLTTLVSPGYAPFEQYHSKSDQQGPWTDIYGLGATLYRAVAGVPPMDALDRSRLILKGGRDTFVSALEVGKGRYSERFLLAIDHALQFREEDRPQSIAEWRGEFAASGATPARAGRSVPRVETATPTVKATLPFQAPPVPPSAVPVRPASARRNLVAAALIAAVLVIGGWYYLDWLKRQDKLAHQSSVQQLLDRAASDLKAGRLIEPAPDNALARYREVLRLEPRNSEAEQGVRAVAARLVVAARSEIAAGRLDSAEQWLVEAVALWPEASNIAIAREELNAAQASSRQRNEDLQAAVGEATAAIGRNDIEAAMGAFQRAEEMGADPTQLSEVRTSLKLALDSHIAAAAQETRRAIAAKNPAAARAALRRANSLRAQAEQLARPK